MVLLIIEDVQLNLNISQWEEGNVETQGEGWAQQQGLTLAIQKSQQGGKLERGQLEGWLLE